MTERDDRGDQTERFDRIDQQLDRINQHLERADKRFDDVDKRFERSDQTMDRLLTLAMDHGRDIGEIKGDVRQMRVSMDGLHEAFTEHLGWHLGRAQGA